MESALYLFFLKKLLKIEVFLLQFTFIEVKIEVFLLQFTFIEVMIGSQRCWWVFRFLQS